MDELSGSATDKPKSRRLSHLVKAIKENWVLELGVFVVGGTILYAILKLAPFNAVDGIFHLTKNLRPRILTKVPEEISSTYAKICTVEPKADNSCQNDDLLFHVDKDKQQRVTISVRVEGEKEREIFPITLQLNGHAVKEGPEPELEDKEVYRFTNEEDFDLTPTLLASYRNKGFVPVNQLRIVTPDPAQVKHPFTVTLLVKVHQALHEHYDTDADADAGAER
jgi:hypothetical protein